MQRALVDAFGGFATLARETGTAWRDWRAAVAKCDSAAQALQASAAERDLLEARRRELSTLNISADEWTSLSHQQSRLAHAAALLEAAAAGEEAMIEGDEALARRLSAVIAKLAAPARDPALAAIVSLLEPARIQIDEAARALRRYRQTLDLDPRELARIDERLAAIHEVARKHRVRPEALPTLLADTEARLAALSESADAAMLAKRATDAEARYRALAGELSAKRVCRARARDACHRSDAAPRHGRRAARNRAGTPGDTRGLR